jgi:quinone-modifying oxidoreductase subunit QmoC
VEIAEQTSQGKPVWVEPDLDFIQALRKRAGESYKKCFQCGTCSATCGLSPDKAAFPRKEMAWAAWGMKERLLKDPDIWLCHQCNDCSLNCPRGARPGDVLAAVRQVSVAHYSVPRFLGKWVSQPKFIPLLLGIPALLLGLAILVREPIEEALGISHYTSDVVFSHSPWFPHWLLNSFFGLFSFLAFIVTAAGVVRYWRILKTGGVGNGAGPPAKALGPAVMAALKSIFMHDKFTQCTTATARSFSHVFVFFGFIALIVVTLWTITGRYNPLIQSDFVYPYGFWSPWKMLANLGGAAALFGCIWMVWERLERSEKAGISTYFDFAFVLTLGLVVLTGFVSEGMHYLRLVPHRHVAYFIHLVFVFALLIYLPYSKFAHLFYRTTAMVYAEYSGRRMGAPAAAAPNKVNRGEGK